MSDPRRPIRQSFAANYDQCARSALLDERAVQFDTHPQARGTVVHLFGEAIIRRCVEEGTETFDAALSKDLMAQLITTAGLNLSAREYDELMDFAWRFAAERSFDVANVIDLEQTYTLEVDGVTVTGRPDLITITPDRVCEVRDWKTSWNIDPAAHVRGTFQGRLYGRMMFEAFPHIAAVRIVIDYLRWGAEREAVLTRSDLPDLDAYLSQLVARIVKSREDDDWPATPGSWCAWCPNPSACPIPPAERGDGSITDPAAAAEAASWLVATDARVAQTKKALRAYASNDDNPRDPLVVGDLEFGFSKRADSAQCIDRDELRRAMERAGLDWADHFKERKGYTEFRARKRKQAA